MLDQQLQHNVIQELECEPTIRATDIDVQVHEGVVSLSGLVDTYAEKLEAEETAKRVFGVKGVANEVEVNHPSDADHSDQLIAEKAVHALQTAATVPAGRIQVVVREGALILEGEVDWQQQEAAAISAIRGVCGARVIRSRIRVRS